MHPNANDSLLVKMIKICALYVFPAIIVALILIISFIPAEKKEDAGERAAKRAAEIDAAIEKLQVEKARLSR